MALHDPGRLRLFLALLFLALALPSAVLIWQTQRQLRWESLHQYRTLAEEMARRIDSELARRVAIEEARSEGDYQYLVLTGDPDSSKLLQRSPLAEIDAPDRFPGLLGHFQINPDGAFSTPLLPVEEAALDPVLGLIEAERDQRQALQAQMLQVLLRNRLIDQQPPVASLDRANERLEKAELASSVQPGPSEEASQRSQAGFDQLAQAPQNTYSNALGRVDELRLNRDYADSDQVQQREAGQAQQLQSAAPRQKRSERSATPEVLGSLAGQRGAMLPELDIRIFESEVEPLAFAVLESGHGVLYRRVWRDGGRVIQGLLLDLPQFAEGLVAAAFVGTSLWEMSDLVLAHQEDVLQLVPGQTTRGDLSRASQVQGELLYQARLSAPLDQMQLIWSIRRLPAGPGAPLILMASVVLGVVLLLGFALLHRLGMRQLRLARQQQDFVAAVSHELKTPLTSIRMYAEMLREGWASEAQKLGYYDYIHDESERLSRLIANVLQLARLERNALTLDLQPRPLNELVDLLRSKLDSQIRRAGFAVQYRIAADCEGLSVAVDRDALCQMLINLVDNALKFSRDAECRELEISVSRVDQLIQFSVRDHGPGIPKAQLQKIFGLFYRPGNELTRESAGTGIGLALVRQLARAMGGEVSVSNRQPGAEFQVRLPQGATDDSKHGPFFRAHCE